MHERAGTTMGKRVLLLYQSWVRREWFDTFKRREGFNISLIQDKLLYKMSKELNGSVILSEIEQV